MTKSTEFSRYRVVINADESGLREVQVFPPPTKDVADVLHASLEKLVEAANDRPKGHVMEASDTKDSVHGEGIRFLVLYCIQPSTLKWLGQEAVDVLSSRTGLWVDITHNLELEAEYQRSQPYIQDAVTKREYL